MSEESSRDALPSGASALVDSVRDALRKVIDPEAGINIVELGLVYRIVEREGTVELDITMTSPTCPMGDMILDEAEQAVREVLPDGVTLELNLVWEPPWSPERMSDSARSHFGW